MAVSPAYVNDTTLAVTTYGHGVYLSEDGGQTWETRNTGLLYPRFADIEFSPNYAEDNTLFANGNWYVYRSTDQGKTRVSIRLARRDWVSVVGALQKQFYKRGLHPNWLPILDSNHWPVFPRNVVVSPDFKSDRTLYIDSSTRRIFRSVDRGQTWASIWQGGQRGYVDLAISPHFISDNTLYAGDSMTGMVYKSIDRGETWQVAYQPKASPQRKRLHLAISPFYKEDRIVFASTPDGLIKTSTGGDHWEQVTSTHFQTDDTVAALALSPDYQQDKTILVSIKGKGLFKYLEDRSEWVEVGSNLINNNYLLYFIDASPNYANDTTLYGASIETLFRSTDGGDTWQLLTDFSNRTLSQ